MHGKIYIGCCGFPVSVDTYKHTLPTVEIQSTFYQLPRKETAFCWRSKVPENFVFWMKAWQGITHLCTSPTFRKYRKGVSENTQKYYGHFQQTDEVLTAWEETKSIAEILRVKGVIFQCPPNFHQTENAIANLINFIRAILPTPFYLALEFRSSWDREIVRKICSEFNLIHCVDPFKEEPQYGVPRYYRLHGSPPGPLMYRYRYTFDDFLFLKQRLEHDSFTGRDVYCFFNTNAMWHDACAFQEFYRRSC
ncbi:MAG: DUF72 domain-containing protein [Bacteroidetes bacterium]|nr:DUF72 domain-containing protein [Bacteroidota bacterium]